ncbi:MAG: hypothetical protein OEY44_00150 [Candidatus Peregrinibacteria bacterium]|nr:hypothetical protein [Candidatus Peregrinibacteria bacterium]
MHHSSLSPKGLGIALAALSGLFMLLISLLGLAGYFQEGIALMQAHHIGYNLTLPGIIIGILEAVIFSYVAGYLFGAIYNKYA